MEGRTNQISLTSGPVLSTLIKVALPIMGASFLQMAYNLTDIFWISARGHKAIAGIGLAGFYIWLSNAFISLTRIGTEVLVAQRTGAGEEEKARDYARNGIMLSIIFGLLYAGLLFIFRKPLIGFFGAGDHEINNIGESYLAVVVIGLAMTFISMTITGIYNARGNAAQGFKVNAVGLLVNMILDPILILGFGKIPAMGAVGAAIATVIAQAAVLGIFCILIFKNKRLFLNFSLFKTDKSDREYRRDILRLGTAPAFHSGLFTLIAMVIGRQVASYGGEANAVQKLGTQVESLSWMTANGIGSALSAFVGQNFGAKQYKRAREGFIAGMKLAAVVGIVTTVILYFGAKFIMMLFISSEPSLSMGTDYLKILAISQLFMAVEITCTGVFNGLGVTKPPAIIGVGFNLLRIPLAIWLADTALGLNGIWWSISSTSLAKGIIALGILLVVIRKKLVDVDETTDIKEFR